jgi:hypothetical protein
MKRERTDGNPPPVRRSLLLAMPQRMRVTIVELVLPPTSARTT